MNASAKRIRLLAPAKGLSLIEILVAMTISALLLLGLSQIFIGSKVAYSLQAGMSRSQENARFIFSFLEDNLRMTGYLGCGNESDATLQYYNHIPTTPASDTQNVVRFSRPIQGFEYTNCGQDSCSTDGVADPPPGAAGDWTPSLTQSGVLPSSTARPVAGSDVLVLRILSSASAAVVTTPAGPAFNPTTGTFNLGSVPNDSNFVTVGGVYAATNCRPRVDIFRASAGSANTVLIGGSTDNAMRNPNGTGPNDTWGFTNAEGEFKQPPLGTPEGTLNAEIHKAEFLAIFVGSSEVGNPALKVQRYANTGGGAFPSLTTEEIADGVEAMQLWYGIDSDGDGLANSFVRADEIPNTGTPVQIDAAWRQVVSVRIALLMRSQDPVGTAPRTGGNVFHLGGEDATTAPFTKMTRPDDHRFRDVYETTIALRNRLTGF